MLGGEQSGHLLFLDHATTGDGIVSALQLLVGDARDRPAAVRPRRLPHQVPAGPRERARARRSRRLIPSTGWPPRVAALEGQMNGAGRILLRYSGTELLARVMVEGAGAARRSRGSPRSWRASSTRPSARDRPAGDPPGRRSAASASTSRRSRACGAWWSAGRIASSEGLHRRGDRVLPAPPRSRSPTSPRASPPRRRPSRRWAPGCHGRALARARGAARARRGADPGAVGKSAAIARAKGASRILSPSPTTATMRSPR